MDAHQLVFAKDFNLLRAEAMDPPSSLGVFQTTQGDFSSQITSSTKSTDRISMVSQTCGPYTLKVCHSDMSGVTLLLH